MNHHAAPDNFTPPLPSTWPVAFVSGMLTGDGTQESVDANVKTACEYGNLLARIGYTVIVPHLSVHIDTPPPLPYEYWIAADLAILARCDEIWMMPWWERSKGACIEHAFAADRGIRIGYFPCEPLEVNHAVA